MTDHTFHAKTVKNRPPRSGKRRHMKSAWSSPQDQLRQTIIPWMGCHRGVIFSSPITSVKISKYSLCMYTVRKKLRDFFQKFRFFLLPEGAAALTVYNFSPLK